MVPRFPVSHFQPPPYFYINFGILKCTTSPVKLNCTVVYVTSSTTPVISSSSLPGGSALQWAESKLYCARQHLYQYSGSGNLAPVTSATILRFQQPIVDLEIWVRSRSRSPLGGAVAVWVASRPEACRLSQLQGCGFESTPLTSIA